MKLYLHQSQWDWINGSPEGRAERALWENAGFTFHLLPRIPR